MPDREPGATGPAGLGDPSDPEVLAGQLVLHCYSGWPKPLEEKLPEIIKLFQQKA